MTLYFAYASNMSSEAMRRRCPSARVRGPALLHGWKYIITRSGYASIVPQPHSTVHGVLWKLTPRDLAALNAYEALDSGLYRRKIVPIRFSRRTLPALTFVGRDTEHGRPQSGYHTGVVLPAARTWGFPTRYVAQLARWSTTSWRGAGTAEPGQRR